MAEPLLIAKHDTIECHLLPGLANRHGLITGATGTGKTVTLQTLAENFSRIGVPVFMADVKGDLTGASQPGKIGEKLAAVLKERGLPMPTPLACPTTLWDVFGEQGHPVRATVSDMGPLLLGRMLNLNETQLGVLNLVFKIANDTPYGLAAAVWTADISKAHLTAKALRAGSVWVNQYDGGDMTAPFGGFKQSGNGRDKSLHAFDKYTELKSTWIKL